MPCRREHARSGRRYAGAFWGRKTWSRPRRSGISRGPSRGANGWARSRAARVRPRGRRPPRKPHAARRAGARPLEIRAPPSRAVSDAGAWGLAFNCEKPSTERDPRLSAAPFVAGGSRPGARRASGPSGRRRQPRAPPRGSPRRSGAACRAPPKADAAPGGPRSTGSPRSRARRRRRRRRLLGSKARNAARPWRCRRNRPNHRARCPRTGPR